MRRFACDLKIAFLNTFYIFRNASLLGEDMRWRLKCNKEPLHDVDMLYFESYVPWTKRIFNKLGKLWPPVKCVPS